MNISDRNGGLRKTMWSPPGKQSPQFQSDTGNPPLLVIGLGNPILGDDGVGWLVVEQIRQWLENGALANQAIEIDSLALGGLSLMERLIGYKRVIIVDALTTHQQPIGSLYTVPLESLPNLSAGHTTAAHDTSLQTALEVGHSMGVELPEQIMVIGIEADKVYDFTEELTPEVEEAIPKAVQIVQDLLLEWLDKDN